MTYAKLLLAVVGLLGDLVSWMKAKQLMDAGAAKAIAEAMRAQADEIHQAEVVRSSVRDDLTAHPDRVRVNDGFRRD